MTIDVRPAHRFDDVAAVLGPKNPLASVCWCLSYRLPSAENRALTGPARGERVRELCAGELAPGVLAYRDGEVVGWAGVAPREHLAAFARSRQIPQVDDRPVWTLWCIRVRPGFRKQGLTAALVDGAAAFAQSNGAPVIEGYPVDNAGERVDLTMAYVGTRAMFERAGFRKVADTTSVLAGFPRIVMRRELSSWDQEPLIGC